MEAISSHGQPIPPEAFALLKPDNDSLSDPQALAARLEEQGFLFLKGVLDRAAVLAARREVFARLAAVGEIRNDSDVAEGLATGVSRRAEVVGDLGAFWKETSELPSLRAVTHEGALLNLFGQIFAEPARPFDFLWLRATPVGRATGFHFDHVYMNRGSDRLLTGWIPLGDVPLCDGPLLIVENSHRFKDLVDEYRGLDVDKNPQKSGTISLSPLDLVRERNVRLMSADFEAGDVVILSMFCLHGSLDNVSKDNRVRLSCDVRYQPAADPMDERWVGENPIGHGQGYGSLGSARPLFSDPIFR